GSRFFFLDQDRELQQEEPLKRIKGLVIPPAWERVWICKLENGHLQATGYDKNNRKQYRYHAQWVALRNQTKYYRLREFAERLPQIRARRQEDLALGGFPRRKVLAAVVSLLEFVNVRVGSAFYEKLYGSFGLTTLKNRHADVKGSRLHFSFKGKKGVRRQVSLKNRRLARIVQGCKEIPGKELFEYYDESGEVQGVDSGMVNEYIRDIAAGDFTAKDFRTWAGSVTALEALAQAGGFDTQAEMNRKIAAAMDLVAQKLGNTRAVTRKYYVHPLILELYQQNKLEQYTRLLYKASDDDDQTGYSAAEKVLLTILQTNGS
ncbi:MAG: DNA topoisomerase IB, partial [Bacteroidales bacterium]